MINTQLWSVQWFVNKWQAMINESKGDVDKARKLADEIIETEINVDRPPRQFDKNECITWHYPKNVSRARLAFEHVFDGKPLPIYDSASKLIAEKEKIKRELEAKLKEATLNKEIAELEEKLAKAEADKKAERKVAKKTVKAEEKKENE